jgi:capsular polysaccharide biosynthesis protein/Mrp family chromosome partitioning ATPase
VSATPQYTSLQDYRRVLRKQRVLVVLIILAFTGAAVGLSLRQTPRYEATAAIDVKQENADLTDVGLGAPLTQTPEQLAAISAERVTQPDVVERVNEKLKLKLATTNLADVLTAAPEARTNLVAITAQASTAARAAQLANAFADATRELITAGRRKEYGDRAKTFQASLKQIPNTPANGYTRAGLVDRISRLKNLADIAEPVSVVRRAEAPDTPFSPQPIRNTVLGFLLGLTIALVAAVVRDALDRRFKNSSEIRDAFHLPLIGHVRDDLLGRSIPSANGRTLTAPDLDVFRIVRTNVEFLNVDTPIKRIAVTSAVADEGKSTVAGALAAAYALAGSRALLVECDLRRPTLAKRLGLNAEPGLADYLVGHAEPQDVLQAVELKAEGAAAAAPALNGRPVKPGVHGSMVCITAGSHTPQPAELLGSQRFQSFLDQVSDVYDVIVLDTCPLLSVVDTLGLVPAVDALIVCVRASRTTRDQATAARAAIQHLPSRPSAVVITGVRAGSEADYGYYTYAYATPA